MFFIASNGLDPIKAADLFCVVGAGTAEGVGAAPACATTGGGVVAATGCPSKGPRSEVGVS